METQKIDYKLIKKCVREVRDDIEWVKGARQENRQSSSSVEYNLVKKEVGELIRRDYSQEKGTSSSSLMENVN